MRGGALLEYTGGCHCGAVRFACDAESHLVALDCNCSNCNMRRNTHFVVPMGRFRLLKGEDQITTYTYNTHVAKHKFCNVCGICAFYIPRSNPDSMAVTLHCLDSPQKFEYTSEIKKFDGVNWESNIDELHKSQQEKKA